MARPSKDGKYLNCYIDSKIYDKLDTLAEMIDIKKTAILEEALATYLSLFQNKNGDIQGVEAIYRDGDTEYSKRIGKINIIRKKCLVLDEMIMNNELYSKIYVNGYILKVPSSQIEYPD